MTSSRAKAAERQTVLKKLLPLLKKHYKIAVPKSDRPVLETMLYSVCLENLSPEEADRCYAKFHQEFPDLNEARVSQVSELERAFPGMADGEWRGFRLRAVLQFVFEKSFTFEFESLRKKTLDLAVKQLSRLKHATPFMRNYTLQNAVGAHILPIDDVMKRLLVWLGLGAPSQSEDELSEALKSSVRKADALSFCIAVRMAAADPKIQSSLPTLESAPAEGFDPATAIDRLQQALSRSAAKPKAAAKSTASKSPPAKPQAAARKPAVPKATASKTAPGKKAAKTSGRSK